MFQTFVLDFSDPDLTRTPKDSSRYLAQLIEDNGFPGPEAIAHDRVAREVSEEVDSYSSGSSLKFTLSVLAVSIIASAIGIFHI